jgi:hypothetical protein
VGSSTCKFWLPIVKERVKPADFFGAVRRGAVRRTWSCKIGFFNALKQERKYGAEKRKITVVLMR